MFYIFVISLKISIIYNVYPVKKMMQTGLKKIKLQLFNFLNSNEIILSSLFQSNFTPNLKLSRSRSCSIHFLSMLFAI